MQLLQILKKYGLNLEKSMSNMIKYRPGQEWLLSNSDYAAPKAEENPDEIQTKPKRNPGKFKTQPRLPREQTHRKA